VTGEGQMGGEVTGGIELGRRISRGLEGSGWREGDDVLPHKREKGRGFEALEWRFSPSCNGEWWRWWWF
jgi:hypothetical protein